MNRIQLFFIFLNFTLSLSCSSQELNVNDFLKEYKSLKIHFINDKLFNKSRKLVFDSIKTKDIQNDTIVFVEHFTDETTHYSCGFYESGKTVCYEVGYEYNEEGRRNNKLKVRETNLCGMTSIIINAIHNNSFNDILKEGKNQRFTPNAIVLITIAIKEIDDYSIKTYMINEFKE